MIGKERRYRLMGRFELLLNMLIPVLIVVTLTVANVFPSAAGETSGASLWWSAGIAGFGAIFVLRNALLAHAITIHPDGQVQFQKIFGSTVVHPLEIHAVGPSRIPPFLSIRSTKGTVLLPHNWPGLEEFIGYLRKGNPNLYLK